MLKKKYEIINENEKPAGKVFLEKLRPRIICYVTTDGKTARRTVILTKIT